MNHNPELKFDAPSLEAVTHTRAQIKALKLRIRQLMASVQKVIIWFNPRPFNAI